MSDEKQTCPKCSSEMTAGMLIDLHHKNPVVEIAEQMEWVKNDTGQIGLAFQLHELECLARRVRNFGPQPQFPDEIELPS